MHIDVDKVHHSYSLTGRNTKDHTKGQTKALDDISFSLAPGFTVLLGPNGAGKSTLFSLLTGLSPLTEGEIRFDDSSLNDARRQIMSRMGVVFQQNTLDLDLTVKQNLTYFAALHGLSGQQALHNIKTLLDDLELTERLHKKVRALNGGHRRRVEIARSLIHSPSVLLLDEPTVGLDIDTREAIVNFVHHISKQRQITVLWATHLLEEVYPDDHLLVLSHGKLRANGQCADLLNSYQCDTTAALFQLLTGEQS